MTEAIVNGTEKGGVPASEREVGTDSHFRYVCSMVPSGRNFINKYKVRKK